jgi:DNA-directed RNA polymerase subunit RPC12/RpoP
MKKAMALAGIALSLLPAVSVAASAATMIYQCVKCHMKYTAAQAKKDHYKCPMDGGKLILIKPSHSGGSMSGMHM